MSFSATYELVLVVIGTITGDMKTTDEVIASLEIKAKAQGLTLGVDNPKKIGAALVKLAGDGYLTREVKVGHDEWTRTDKTDDDGYLTHTI